MKRSCSKISLTKLKILKNEVPTERHQTARRFNIHSDVAAIKNVNAVLPVY